MLNIEKKTEHLFLLCATVCDRMEKQGRRDTGSRERSIKS